LNARGIGIVFAAAATLALVLAVWKHWLPLDLTEALGFVTGAWCVWLTAEENIWNWPIGIANSLFFGLLFLHSQLYADMGLQVVYVVLGAFGWYWWLHGGRSQSRLAVSHTPFLTALVVAIIVAAATLGMTLYLRHVHDSAPFWDAVTTTLSLAAQYLLTKKWLENWYVWMTADVIYVGLYVYKHLYLTSALYLLFLCLCVFGLRQWRQSLVPVESVHG